MRVVPAGGAARSSDEAWQRYRVRSGGSTRSRDGGTSPVVRALRLSSGRRLLLRAGTAAVLELQPVRQWPCSLSAMDTGQSAVPCRPDLWPTLLWLAAIEAAAAAAKKSPAR